MKSEKWKSKTFPNFVREGFWHVAPKKISMLLVGLYRQCRYHYKFTKYSPQTPNDKPTTFLMLSFSLNANTELIHTKTIPSPLNNGKRTTDGTLPANFVITTLIMDSETALPMAQISTDFLLFLSTIEFYISMKSQDNSDV